MADFKQSAATRQAMQDAARKYLRRPGIITALAGTSDKKATAYKSAQRRVERWTTTAQQQRKPSAVALTVVGAIRVEVTADYAVGGDNKYLRKGKHMAWTLTQEETQQFLKDALSQPDEAWQDFFEAYVIPAGTVEHASISLR